VPVFIELTTDIFSGVFKDQNNGQRRSHRAGSNSVRRPLRGAEIKDDTYAIIKAVDVAGAPLRVFDSSARRANDPYHTKNEGTEYANFLLQSVNEVRMEKHQIVETFGESYIFFFGEAPRFLDVQAALINSNDFNWEAEFWQNYETFWRGSKLTELGARLYLFYDDTIVEGYMLQAQAQKNAQDPLMVSLSFRLFVTNYTNISFIDSDDFPVRGSVDSSILGDLTAEGRAAGFQYLANRASFERGAAEQAAALAIQKQALSDFGGGSLLAAALRRGVTPGMGPMLTGGPGFGASASASASASAFAGAGLGAGASAGAFAGASVSASAFAGVSGGVFAGAGAQAGANVNTGQGVFTSGSYSGFAPTGFPPTGGVSAGYSYQAGVGPGGTYESTSATEDGVITVNSSVNGQPQATVSGPAGQGSFAQSPFYPPPPSGLPFAGASVGLNPFAPNPFAPRPFAPNAYGVNPYFPNPYAPTPFSPTGRRQPTGTSSNYFSNAYQPPGTRRPSYGFPRDSIFGPGYSGIPNKGKEQRTAPDPNLVRSSPLRGKIWENTDEWTGASPQSDNADYSEAAEMTDVEDLPYSSFLLLGAYGVGLDGFASLGALGLAPRFSPGGVGIGAGARASASASFGLSAGASASFGANASFSAGASFGASASVSASAGIGPNGPYAATTSQSFAGSTRPGASPYDNYPGFGAGYGSALPGLRGGFSPGGRFGVGASAGVFPGDSFGGGIGAGGTFMVGGVPTCFAFDSFPGVLAVGGGAFLSPDGTVSTSSFVAGPDGATFTQTTDSL